jgi:peptidoglycan/xylan/chitin deacetylase (PgdA/CDA1 family)
VATNARRGVGLGTQRVLWSLDSATDVALTFDDGPDPDLTPVALDILDRYDVRATFMLIGRFASEQPGLVRRIRDAGHEVGNHTWSHPGLDDLPADQVRSQLGRTADLLGPMRFFRPPRGLLSGIAVQAAGELGYDVLMWSTEAGEPFRPGDLCVLHDGLGRAGFDPSSPKAAAMRAKRRAELDALPAALEDALGRGVRFVAVPPDTATTAV